MKETLITATCTFATNRLIVGEWHKMSEGGPSLIDVVAAILTTTTTQALPPDWQGDYSRARAELWVEERDAESPTLLVCVAESGAAAGLVMLFEERSADGVVEVRLGYVIEEALWGRGFASELVAGLVDWCRTEGSIRSISGGVEASNIASARVLEKNGFGLAPDSTSEHHIYTLLM
jgi:RimJ/RimL family protein N-acetyltransferase